MAKYSKQDAKIFREFLNNMYDHHQSLKGGSAFTDFLHGFLTPFKQFAGLIPGVSKVLQPIAQSVDSMIPGKKYDTIQDILNNKPSSGSGMKRGRGRPRKIQDVQVEVINIDPVKALYVETKKETVMYFTQKCKDYYYKSFYF